MVIKVAEDEAINEAFPKAVEDLMAPDGWVHHEFELNTLGRYMTFPPIYQNAVARLFFSEISANKNERDMFRLTIWLLSQRQR